MTTSLPPEMLVSPAPLRFALVAGEASGDLLGADLIVNLRMRFPDAQFVGIGGPKMIAAGLEAWYPAEKLSVMGIVEVLRHLPELLLIRHTLRKRLLELKPDCFIGIDAPDFNLGLERKLKAAGIRTVHYVSPSIWAWREGRAAKMRKSTDLMLCLFPMEPAIYERYAVKAVFVGHPLADQFPLILDKIGARANLGLPANVPVLALLPGSRLGEIQRMGADFIAAAALCQRDAPHLQIVAPMANHSCRKIFSNLIDQFNNTDHATHTANAAKPKLTITLLDGQAHQVLCAADAVMLASGTAALEALLARVPMVVAYRLARLTYRLVTGLGLLRTQRYSLPNILAGCDLVPELMQDACTPQNLAREILPFLSTRTLPIKLAAQFEHIHSNLRQNAGANATEAIARFMTSRACP